MSPWARSLVSNLKNLTHVQNLIDSARAHKPWDSGIPGHGDGAGGRGVGHRMRDKMHLSDNLRI